MNQPVQDSNPQGLLSGLLIALISSLFSTVFYGAFSTLTYIKNLKPGQAQIVFVQIVSIIMCVFLAQFLARKIQGNKLSFMQALLIGWMTALMLAMFVAAYYTIFSKITGNNILPKGAFAMLLLLYSGLGMVWSIIIGVFLKKE